MQTQTRCAPEVREKAVRVVLQHEGEHDSQRECDRFDHGEDRLHRRDPAQQGCGRPSVTSVRRPSSPAARLDR